MFYKLRKLRAEAKLALRKNQQDKLTLETKANAQLVLIYANAVKQKAPTQDVEFSEVMLRNALGKDASRLHAVIELLSKEGKAKPAEDPGYWIID